jgi:putative dimethyl sulfoxide reductase chaperone
VTIESDDRRRGRAALCRAAAYRALARGFGEPDEALLEALSSGSFTGELGEAIGGLVVPQACFGAVQDIVRWAAQASAAPKAALESLRVEYARLFTGPGRPAVAAYESEYLEPPRADGRGRLGGAVAAAVEAAYAREGIATAAGRREPPDFVTVELEFLYVLNVREAEAWAAGDGEEARRLSSACERFHEEHARRWLPALADAVGAESSHPFYSALADLLGYVVGPSRPAARPRSAATGYGGAE